MEMTGESDNRGWSDGWQDLGSVPAAPPGWGGGASGETPPLGAGCYPSQVEAMFAERRRRRSGHSPFSILAAACGLVGFFHGPFLVGDTPDRYAILVADIAPLGLGSVAVWAAVTRSSRLEWAIAGILGGAVSLALYILCVSKPPAPAGST